MSVHYKFKSAISFDTITFDGLHISVKDLKKAILQQKQIGKATDFDLQITNAQSDEVYDNDTTLIPKNSSLIVVRIPLTAQQKKAWEKSDSSAQVLGFNKTSAGDCDPHASKLAKTVDLANVDASEEDKIQAAITQSTLEYDPSNYLKIKGSNQVGELPANYRCYKCFQPGHWIRDCKLNAQQDSIEIKKSTGIPRSFMVPVEGPDVPGAMMTPSGQFAVPSIEHEARKEPLKKPVESNPLEKPSIPDDLVCGVCKDLLSDAVLIPCCGNSFCDECIRNVLLESEDLQCPDCREKDVSPDTLIPNRFLRNSVLNFKNQTGYTKPPREPVEVPESTGEEPVVETPTSTKSPEPVEIESKPVTPPVDNKSLSPPTAVISDEKSNDPPSPQEKPHSDVEIFDESSGHTIDTLAPIPTIESVTHSHTHSHTGNHNHPIRSRLHVHGHGNHTGPGHRVRNISNIPVRPPHSQNAPSLIPKNNEGLNHPPMRMDNYFHHKHHERSATPTVDERSHAMEPAQTYHIESLAHPRLPVNQPVHMYNPGGPYLYRPPVQWNTHANMEMDIYHQGIEMRNSYRPDTYNQRGGGHQYGLRNVSPVNGTGLHPTGEHQHVLRELSKFMQPKNDKLKRKSRSSSPDTYFDRRSRTPPRLRNRRRTKSRTPIRGRSRSPRSKSRSRSRSRSRRRRMRSRNRSHSFSISSRSRSRSRSLSRERHSSPLDVDRRRDLRHHDRLPVSSHALSPIGSQYSKEEDYLYSRSGRLEPIGGRSSRHGTSRRRPPDSYSRSNDRLESTRYSSRERSERSYKRYKDDPTTSRYEGFDFRDKPIRDDWEKTREMEYERMKRETGRSDYYNLRRSRERRSDSRDRDHDRERARDHERDRDREGHDRDKDRDREHERDRDRDRDRMRDHDREDRMSHIEKERARHSDDDRSRRPVEIIESTVREKVTSSMEIRDRVLIPVKQSSMEREPNKAASLEKPSKEERPKQSHSEEKRERKEKREKHVEKDVTKRSSPEELPSVTSSVPAINHELDTESIKSDPSFSLDDSLKEKEEGELDERDEYMEPPEKCIPKPNTTGDIVLAHLPELSKWEKDDVASPGSYYSDDRRLHRDSVEKNKEVTTEVLRRAENAIFKKGLNPIKPSSLADRRLDRKKEMERIVTTPKSVVLPVKAEAHSSSETLKPIENREKKKSPVRIPAKERLGAKVEPSTFHETDLRMAKRDFKVIAQAPKSIVRRERSRSRERRDRRRVERDWSEGQERRYLKDDRELSHEERERKSREKRDHRKEERGVSRESRGNRGVSESSRGKHKKRKERRSHEMDQENTERSHSGDRKEKKLIEGKDFREDRAESIEKKPQRKDKEKDCESKVGSGETKEKKKREDKSDDGGLTSKEKRDVKKEKKESRKHHDIKRKSDKAQEHSHEKKIKMKHSKTEEATDDKDKKNDSSASIEEGEIKSDKPSKKRPTTENSPNEPDQKKIRMSKIEEEEEERDENTCLESSNTKKEPGGDEDNQDKISVNTTEKTGEEGSDSGDSDKKLKRKKKKKKKSKSKKKKKASSSDSESSSSASDSETDKKKRKHKHKKSKKRKKSKK